MKLRRFLAVLLALIMATGATTAFAAGTFTDVAADAYYAEAVQWAVENGITNGMGDGRFAPEETVNRAQAVTFLWRLMGKPEPTKAQTFPDVESDPNNSWYKTAVQWAVEQGITNGTGTGFSPTVTCSRGMILTMLYRMEGSPLDEAMAAALPEDSEELTLEELGFAMIQGFVEGIRSANVIPDVKEGAYYELPVFWAMLFGILTEEQVDPESGAVHPDAPCPRGEMVSFLLADSKYQEMLSDDWTASEPVAVGTVPETVVLNKNGAKITVTGIETDDGGDAMLDCTIENASAKKLAVDVGSLFVNTFCTSPSTYIPIVEGNVTYYDNTIIADPGETKNFYVGLNDLREKGITTVYELELQMFASVVTEIEDGYEFEEYAGGEPVTIRTDLYTEGLTYDMEGTTVCDKDGLKVLVCKAENDEYRGPQIAVYAYNGGNETVSLEVAELKLDGKTCDAFFSMDVPAGKRGVETIYLDIDYENLPVVKQAEISIRTLDQETWEPKDTFAPVTIPFQP